MPIFEFVDLFQVSFTLFRRYIDIPITPLPDDQDSQVRYHKKDNFYDQGRTMISCFKIIGLLTKYFKVTLFIASHKFD